MFHVFRPFYPAHAGETEDQIHDLLIDDILGLNGKPSIHQMTRFVERAHQRGKTAPTPNELLREYQMRLDQAIEVRSEKIRRGETRPDEFVIHGARAFLERLAGRGVVLIILSGTVEHRVKEEARLLELGKFFGKHIYGSHPDRDDFSKQDVIARVLREEKIRGEHLLSFGDGPIEIFHTKEMGGLAIGVATDENRNGSGEMDAHKRKQLNQAGADTLIADYRDPDSLIEMIFGA